MRFQLADQRQEAQLRELVRLEAMPGHMQLRYEREPDFFHGQQILGSFYQTLVGTEVDEVVGFGCRSVRPMYFNGREVDLGYLSGLRSKPSARGSMGLAKGYRFLKQLHEDGRCPGYLTTIIHGNEVAMRTIAQGRAGLPHYHSLGTGVTASIALNRKRPRCSRSSSSVEVRFARENERLLVVDLLNKLGTPKQFYPRIHSADFSSALMRDLSPEQFLLAFSGDRPCGVAGIWDQSNFKQQRICGYETKLKLLKCSLNPLLRLIGYPELPEIEEKLRLAYFCFHAVENQNASVFKHMLDAAHDTLAQRGYDFCIVGLHQEDPLIRVLKNYFTFNYLSHLFFVDWDKPCKFIDSMQSGSIIHFEPAIL